MFLLAISADLGLFYIHRFKLEIHERICQGLHKIKCHGAPLLQI